MSLVICPECQKEVSSQALACPQCAYPYPGKQDLGDKKLKACEECGGVVSKKAQSCPHCGISFDAIPKNSTVDEETIEESWLCSNCGTPYTRKVPTTSIPAPKIQAQPTIQDQSPIQETPPDIPKSAPRPPVTDGRGLSFTPNVPKLEPVAPLGGRHASPLWIPSATNSERGSSPSPHRKKGTIVVGIVVAFLIVLSLVLWVLWQPTGTNPLDLLP